MKTTLTVLTLAALAGTASAAEISGKVKLSGTPPPEKSEAADVGCGAMAATVTTRHYVVGADKGLGNVFVYVKEGAKATPAAGPKGVLLDQVACQYQPYVVGVQAGQHFDVQNSDPVMHNVHPLPVKPWKSPKNPAQPVKGMKTDFVLDSPEVFVQFKAKNLNSLFPLIFN